MYQAVQVHYTSRFRDMILSSLLFAFNCSKFMNSLDNERSVRHFLHSIQITWAEALCWHA